MINNIIIIPSYSQDKILILIVTSFGATLFRKSKLISCHYLDCQTAILDFDFCAAGARTRSNRTTDTWWPCTSVKRDSLCKTRQWTACTAAKTSGWASNQPA